MWKTNFSTADATLARSALLGHPVADLVGVRGVQMHPPLAASNGFLRT